MHNEQNCGVCAVNSKSQYVCICFVIQSTHVCRDCMYEMDDHACPVEFDEVRMYVALNLQKGRTALHHAAQEGSKECLKVLVHEYRADPEEVDMVS